MLRDVIAHLDLTLFPEIAMLIFLGVFLAVVARAVFLTSRQEADRAASLPLDDGGAVGAGAKEDRR